MAKKSGSFGAGSHLNGALALDRLRGGKVTPDRRRGGEVAPTADAERARKCGAVSRITIVGGGEGAISGNSRAAPTPTKETRVKK